MPADDEGGSWRPTRRTSSGGQHTSAKCRRGAKRRKARLSHHQPVQIRDKRLVLVLEAEAARLAGILEGLQLQRGVSAGAIAEILQRRERHPWTMRGD
jgi:hypothetical protein